jgi:hypothetical protein
VKIVTLKDIVRLRKHIIKYPTENIKAYMEDPRYSEFQAELSELIEWQKDYFAEQYQLRLQRKAEELGIPENITLARYILNLEESISCLTHRVDTLENEKASDIDLISLSHTVDKLENVVSGDWSRG